MAKQLFKCFKSLSDLESDQYYWCISHNYGPNQTEVIGNSTEQFDDIRIV